jgi:hypothetical protein
MVAARGSRGFVTDLRRFILLAVAVAVPVAVVAAATAEASSDARRFTAITGGVAALNRGLAARVPLRFGACFAVVRPSSWSSSFVVVMKRVV